MTLRWITAGLACLVATSASAKEFRVGYIDSEQIIAEYEAAKEAKAELEQEIARFEDEADSLRLEYENALDEYESQELTLSEEGKRAKMAEVEQRRGRYDGYLDEVYRTGGRIDQKNTELIAPIVEKINEVVNALSEEEGFSLVLDASKSEIVYSQTGLDLTDLVIQELNSEFEPTGPTGTEKLYYAVMPIFTESEEAREARVQYTIRDYVYGLAQGEAGAEMVSNSQVNQRLTETGRQVDMELTQAIVLEISRHLNADYAIFGSCSKEDRQIDFELSLVDVGLGNVLDTQQGSAPRDDKLQEEVGRVVQILLANIARP